jgi:hypothetical protein
MLCFGLASFRAGALCLHSPITVVAPNTDGPRDVPGSDSVGVLTITPRGIVVHANEAFLTMVGHARESVPLRLDKLTPLEWQPWDRACLANLVLSRRPCWYHKEFVDAVG